MKILEAIESIKDILETGSCRVGTLAINEEVPKQYYRSLYLNQHYRHEDIDICFDVFENMKNPEILLLKVTLVY